MTFRRSGPRTAYWHRRPMRSLAAAVGVLGLVAMTCAAATPSPAQQAFRGKPWSPFRLPAARSVPGHPLARRALPPLRVREPDARPALRYRPPRNPHWPVPGTALARLDSAGPASGQPGTSSARKSAARPRPVRAGTLPVSFAAADPAAPPAASTARNPVPPPAAVRVTLAGHSAARAAGISGALLTVTRADGTGAAGRVRMTLDYAAMARNYGGGWASRLRLVELPGCALTSPAAAACRRQTPLPGSNDAVSQQITATVPATRAGSVIAATAGPAGPGGNYAATSLRPSGTWLAQQGDFTYSYPITVPSALGGAAPVIALSYDSQSIDGETSGQNTQASWIGDGWNYEPGFIETSYQPCSQDGIANSGDECWGGYNATLSLDGHSSPLVRTASGAWHLQSDDGSSVQQLTGAANGLWSGQYWLVTTTDGTKYYFGLNHLPGDTSSAATNSAWGVPVYNPNSGDPCNTSSAGQASWCQMGYRWNLDAVVDPHGNLTVYNYATETNYYQRGGGQGTGALTSYVRAGYPTSISYGYQLSDAIAGGKPAAQVIFGTAQRCLPTSTFDCAYSSLTSSTASDWPDIPYDQNCGASGSCSNDSPTFWSTVRLTSITTQVQEGSSPQQVDSYALTQTFPDAGGAAQPVMFLDSITRTGEDGTALSLPATTFTPTEVDNRVDGLVPAAPGLYRPRIASITTSTGAAIAVTYSAPACSRVNKTMPASADTNDMPCFPVYWTPPGEVSPILDWFNKSLVQTVTEADQTQAGSPPQVTNYSYLGGAAWHQDDSPLTSDSYRTWDQYRGYAQVETTTGVSPDPVTETVSTYMRGMNGDTTASGGTKAVSVSDSLHESVTDSNWLAGQVLETDTYTKAGGTIDQKVINGPWTFTSTATQAMPGSLPTLTAEMLKTAEVRNLSLLASGTWRTTQTNTTYNPDAQVAQVDAQGDGTSSDPEVCTTDSYATSSANPMMESYVDEVKAVAGACGTTPTSANTVSDVRSYYDGSGNGSLTSMGTLGTITGGGSVTASQKISGYSSGNPQFQADSAATYDEYGRPLSAVDANGYTTATQYDPATGTLPTQTVVTNPMGWKTTTTLDPARGQPTQVTDPNGNSTSESYDSLGRLTAIWLPGRSTSLSASRTFTYSITGTAPATVTTATLRDDGSYSADVKLFDGMLQLRQEQQTPADGAAGRLITDSFYDSHGWTVKSSSPYYDSSASPGPIMFIADDSSVPSQTVTQYDGQGRATASQFYSMGTMQWQTTAAYPGADETDVTPPKGGTASSTFTDALGQTVATWSYADSAAPTGNSSDARVTAYTYTPSGQLATVTDNARNKWVNTYNLLGEKTAQTDPGTGTTSYGYDPDGNITSTTDARGQTLTYTYDKLNRKTAEYAGVASPANELAAWTYDTLAKGEPTTSTAFTGGATGSAYVEAVTGYTATYQPTGTSTTIPAAEGALAGTYTTSSAYTPVTGLLASTTYSADGGLPQEEVDNSYDRAGLLTAMGGNAAYLDATSYDPLGNVLRTTTGPAGKQLAVTSAYDAGTNRLLQATDSVQTGSAATDTTSYTYNPAGGVTSVSDEQGAGGTDTQCFSYNDLQQLTTAWTDTAGTTTAAAPSVAGIGGCNTSTPSAATSGGPSPYWESWTYDALGDRLTQITHDLSGNSSNNVTQTLTYPGNNGTAPSSQPDAATTVATTGPGGTTTTSYSYDGAGNTKGRTSASTGAHPPAGPNQSFSYNPQGQVASVTTGTGSSAQTSKYLYDADGNLLIQRDPAATILYLDGGAEELTLAGGAVSGLRYYSEPDGATVVRSSSGSLTYELASPQGTNTETVSASTLAVTRRYYDPYGSARGSVPSSWPDNRGFLNQPADPASSLDLLGARQYDPATGRFLSVDPVLETGDSRQMGGYAYAADDPVNQSDASGELPISTGGCVGTVQACTGGNPGGGGGSGGGGNGGGGNGGGGNAGAGGSGCWGPGGEWTCGAVTIPTPWNQPKAAPVATMPADPYTCGRFGTGCNPVPMAGSGNGSSGAIGWIIRQAGQITGITDAINCIKNPTLLGCGKALLKGGAFILAVASAGSGAGADVALDATLDETTAVTGDTITEAGDSVVSSADGSATAESGSGETSVATRPSGELKAAESRSLVQRAKEFAAGCVLGTAVACVATTAQGHLELSSITNPGSYAVAYSAAAGEAEDIDEFEMTIQIRQLPSEFTQEPPH
jgi:RHS repeat-associated protein